MLAREQTMTPLPQYFASLASAAVGARGRIVYFAARGLDPAQARREAVATISRAVGHEASVVGSTDMLILLGALLILALAVVLGLKRPAYFEAAGASFAATTASIPPQASR
jgi:hypothetical protein